MSTKRPIINIKLEQFRTCDTYWYILDSNSLKSVGILKDFTPPKETFDV